LQLKLAAFGFAVQPKVLVLFCRAAKNFGSQQKQLKLTVFVLAQRNFLEFANTKASGLFCRAAKTLGIFQPQSNSN
jgi:hypothetical protein